jgi:hypothetical protein
VKLEKRTWSEAVAAGRAQNATPEQIDERRRFKDGIDPDEVLDHNDLLMKVIFTDSPEFSWARQVGKKLQKLADNFRIQIFEAGWQKAHDKQNASRVKTKLGKVTMLSVTSAGRCLMTLSRGRGKKYEQITFICGDGDNYQHSMGYQSIEASLRAATEIVEAAIEAWDAADSPESLLKSDKSAKINGVF